MIDQPTPETDALHELRNREFRDILSQYFEMVDLSRRMERERNQLREHLAKERAAAEKLAETVGSHEFASENDFTVVGIAYAQWKEARRE